MDNTLCKLLIDNNIFCLTLLETTSFFYINLVISLFLCLPIKETCLAYVICDIDNHLFVKYDCLVQCSSIMFFFCLFLFFSRIICLKKSTSSLRLKYYHCHLNIYLFGRTVAFKRQTSLF